MIIGVEDLVMDQDSWEDLGLDMINTVSNVYCITYCYLVIFLRTKPVKISDKMEGDIEEFMDEWGYASFSEFARDAIRDKLYKKSEEKEISTEFKEKIKKGLEDLEKGRTKDHEKIKEKYGSS